jgi:hypothetical protein
MYEKHPDFHEPENLQIKLWRYIDFTRLVDMLDTSSLYFCRADKFQDRYEGSYPRRNVLARPYIYNMMTGDQIHRLGEINFNWRKYVALNCWHMNHHESAAMWNIYARSGEGVAIQSTFDRLSSAFVCDRDTTYIGSVQYIDYDRDDIPENCIFHPFLFKRKSFEYEHELRCALVRFPPSKNNCLDFSTDAMDSGVRVTVDMDRLVSAIHTAPDSPSWFLRLVESVCEQYGLNKPVIRSQLDEEPVY